MLLQFSMSNYRCFKEEIKLSMIASNYDKSTREAENVVYLPEFDLRLLKSAVVYGANASGKTKLIEGMAFMKYFILQSSKESQIKDQIPVDPFRLSEATEDAPSVFEMIFIHRDTMYRYGFEADRKQIHAEWLFHKPGTKEVELFYREGQHFELNDRKFKVKDLIDRDRIRANALLLSVAANWNDKLAEQILEWFHRFNTISGLKEEGYEGYSIDRFQQSAANKQAMLNMLKEAGLGIDDILIKKLDMDNLPKDMPDEVKSFLRQQKAEKEDAEFFSDLITVHKKYGEDKGMATGKVPFSMNEEESSGTRKFFALTGPVLETLQKGEILVADELANKLHPNLTCKLIEIFNSPSKNPHNAQLIFNTHDTNLLGSGLFRRDQIWFTEKDRYGAATLYSLNDFKSSDVRKGESYERNYIKGKYGAIPFLGDFEHLFPEPLAVSGHEDEG
jgi:AAA15 family ATPase/GTPase